MIKPILPITFLVLCTGLALCPAVGFAQTKVVAYVPNWVDLEAFSREIDYDRLTHINLAFENPTNDEGDLSFRRGNRALIEAAHKHEVTVLVSVAGGAAANDERLRERYFRLLSDEHRPRFVNKLVEYVERHNLDGLDIDIEGPLINDDYGKLLEDLSAALKPKGKLLTAALAHGHGGSRVSNSALEQLDFLNIMAYDAAGPWNPNFPGQHSSLEFAQKSIDYWLGRGLPKEKAVLGVPFYGYGFGKDFRRGGYTYRTLVEKYPGAQQQDQVGETIWYNGIPTIQAKANLVRDQGLGGVMIWSLNQDAPGENSLLGAIDEVLKR